jgi:hypothetical protein
MKNYMKEIEELSEKEIEDRIKTCKNYRGNYFGNYANNLRLITLEKELRERKQCNG